MANQSESKPSNNQEIRFNLEVVATIVEGSVDKGRIDFKLDLNPTQRSIKIDQHLSSYNELLVIFKEIQTQLGEINKKTIAYNDAIRVDDPNKRFLYEENFKPSFGKIDRIHYVHNSPGMSNTSYLRTYNGDMKPPLK